MKTKDWKLVGPMKHECHRLLDLIWGDSKQDRKKAYLWLAENTPVRHFSTENNYANLFKTRKLLQAKAIEDGLVTLDTIETI